MYPRVVDLGSPEVQSLSNRELFWIIKHGIRLSGMPGFGRINTDQEIWQLTYYVRSLGKRPSDQERR
jgi:mono/diheme cytochrome c family protein